MQISPKRKKQLTAAASAVVAALLGILTDYLAELGIVFQTTGV